MQDKGVAPLLVHRYNFYWNVKLRQNVRMGSEEDEGWSLASRYKLYTQHKEMGYYFIFLLSITYLPSDTLRYVMP